MNYKLVVVNVTSPFLLNSFSRLYHSFFTGKRIKTNPISLDFPRDFRLVFIISYGHSAASNLLNMGFSIVQVQQWLGHGSAAATLNLYAHVDKIRNWTWRWLWKRLSINPSDWAIEKLRETDRKQKENPGNPRVSGEEVAGQKDLNSRHAVLEWIWKKHERTYNSQFSTRLNWLYFRNIRSKGF